MRHLTIFFAAAATAMLVNAAPIMAKNKQAKMHCPPGLAKKNPPCIPPGQAKKGDRIGEYPHLWLDPDRYDLDRRFGWYKLGDDLYVRTDKETGEIIQLFNAIAAVLD